MALIEYGSAHGPHRKRAKAQQSNSAFSTLTAEHRLVVHQLPPKAIGRPAHVEPPRVAVFRRSGITCDNLWLMRNIKLTVAYDGTDFRGWQNQPGQPTIQGFLADVVHQLTEERSNLQGSGRTDAGVHAWGQVVNFKTRSELAPADFQRGCNALLPPSIRVRKAEEVGLDFHARWMAQAKTYVYRIYRGAVVPPFSCRYVLHVTQEL